MGVGRAPGVVVAVVGGRAEVDILRIGLVCRGKLQSVDISVASAGLVLRELWDDVVVGYPAFLWGLRDGDYL